MERDHEHAFHRLRTCIRRTWKSGPAYCIDDLGQEDTGATGGHDPIVSYNPALFSTMTVPTWSKRLDTRKEVLSVLDEVLSLNGRAINFALETPLLGALPELDSMAVAGLITMIEERFGIVIEDDEIDGATFASVGSLVGFVDGKLG